MSLSLTAAAATSEGRLNLIVTDLRELFEATRSRERAERDNRTKDDFLAMLAHEVRNPLGAINAALGVLDSGHAAGEVCDPGAWRHRATGGAHLPHAQRPARRRARRLGKDPSRIGSRSTWPRRYEGPWTRLLAMRRLDRDVDIRTVPVWISGDSLRIEQVLTNIVTNAIKYTPPGGQIRVTLGAEAPTPCSSSRTPGPASRPALLPFIFDLYVQSDRTLDRARGGLGIGLTLVRRLVEAHDGTVEASSEGEGLGSRFTVRLRAIPAAETSPRRRFWNVAPNRGGCSSSRTATKHERCCG